MPRKVGDDRAHGVHGKTHAGAAAKIAGCRGFEVVTGKAWGGMEEFHASHPCRVAGIGRCRAKSFAAGKNGGWFT